MISWLLVIIVSYLFFSLAFFSDKLVLSGPPNPRLYTFYVAFLGILAIFLAPFLTFTAPSAFIVFLILLEAIIYVAGLYAMFTALERFEVSRVMTTIGALQPILILAFTWLFFGPQIMNQTHFLAFIMLLAGSVFISFGKKFNITLTYVLLVVFSSVMFSLDYIFTKMVFLYQPFLQGIVLMRVTGALLVLLFLFDKRLRGQIFTKKPSLGKKNGLIFLCGQAAGGTAVFLQSFAISLVPVSYLAIVSSLRGIQYVFLFIITLFFSYFFPKILKEDISLKIILQKIVSIVLIVIGLALLL